MDLATWVPKKILEVSDDISGQFVTDTEWNRRWNLTRVQGDYNSDTLMTILDTLFAGVWHPENGAAGVTSPALPSDLAETPALTVLEQLQYLDARATNLQEQVNAKPDLHADLPDIGSADCHPISAITGLQAALDGLVAGEFQGVSHNLLANRDEADAHPMGSITGLPDLADAVNNILAKSHNDWGNRNAAGAHPASSITYDESSTVAQKIASILTTIQGITGGIAEIAHNSLVDRTEEDAHPMSAITGLVEALADLTAALGTKLDAATAATTYQPKILSGTTTPSNSLGNNGDVYIKYA